MAPELAYLAGLATPWVIVLLVRIGSLLRTWFTARRGRASSRAAPVPTTPAGTTAPRPIAVFVLRPRARAAGANGRRGTKPTPRPSP
jgi:hypothetical protein